MPAVRANIQAAASSVAPRGLYCGVLRGIGRDSLLRRELHGGEVVEAG